MCWYIVYLVIFSNFESHLQILNKDGVEDHNPRVRYGKGRYTYTTMRSTRKGKRKKRPQAPPKRKRYTQKTNTHFGGWKSEHKWQALLDYHYNSYFDLNSSQHDHYLDAIMNKIDPFNDGDGECTNISCGFSTIEDDVFLPVGMYVSDNDIPIVFDSGSSVAVTPNNEDFISSFTKVNKIMMGLGATAKIEGDGRIKW